jgi:hypothetical protein
VFGLDQVKDVREFRPLLQRTGSGEKRPGFWWFGRLIVRRDLVSSRHIPSAAKALRRGGAVA